MSDLIERLEMAEVGSTALNGAIHRLLFPEDLIMTDSGSVGPIKRDAVRQPLKEVPQVPDDVIADCIGVSAYTTSLDAALALAERVLPGWFVGLQQNRGEVPPWSAFLSPPDRMADDVECASATPALALCIATLKPINSARERSDGRHSRARRKRREDYHLLELRIAAGIHPERSTNTLERQGHQRRVGRRQGLYLSVMRRERYNGELVMTDNVNDVMERLEADARGGPVGPVVTGRDDLKALLSYTKQCREALELCSFALETTEACLKTWNEGRGGPASVDGALSAARQALSTQPGERE